MRVYLVQHGLATDKIEDAERPLSSRGREDVARCAEFLSLFEKPCPVKILHSGNLRAQQTADVFAEAWGCLQVEGTPDLAPNDDPFVWSAHLSSLCEDVMLVGHLPHLQQLAGMLLCGDAEREAVHFCNGGVLCLEGGQTGWSVHWQINPNLLW